MNETRRIALHADFYIEVRQKTPTLPAKLVNARHLRRAGLSISGLFVLGSLGLAVREEIPLISAPDWLPYVLITTPAAAVTAFALFKAIMGDALQVELHDGRVYIQYGVPVSGPPLPTASIQVMARTDVDSVRAPNVVVISLPPIVV